MKTTMYRVMVSDGEKPASVWFDTLEAASSYYDSADCADRPEKVTIASGEELCYVGDACTWDELTYGGTIWAKVAKAEPAEAL